MSGADKKPPRGRGLVAALLLAVVLAVRLIALDADPPAWLSWSTGIATDEGFYTLDARHEALFGTWASGDFHDRLLSPLLSLLQQGVFTLFGVGLRPARLISVAFGLLTVFVFWRGLRRAYGKCAGDWGALFLGLAPPFAFYNRLALQETPTVFWLVLAFALWTYGQQAGSLRKRAILLFLAGASAALAVTFKALAAVALPAYLIAWPLFPVRQGERGMPAWGPLFLGFAVVLGLYGLLWYAPHQAELGRMAAFYRGHQMQPHSVGALWRNIGRGLIGGERGVVPYLLATLPVPCVLAGWAVLRKRPWILPDVFLAAWLLCGLLFCLLSSYAPSRYYVLFLPALAGLAARGMGGLRRPVQSAALALFLATSGFWYGWAWTERGYALRDGSRRLARTLPAHSVVVGEFAPALCLETPFAAAPVQPGLSNDDRPVERLRASHIAVTRAKIWQDWWHARYPQIAQPSQRIATFDLGGSRHFIVDIYRVNPLKMQTGRHD